ncbi:MAG: hypothetical protein RXR18_02570 [Nitrososphaeria archaeon]
MAQEFWSEKDQIQSQEMKEVIDLLTKYNVDFKDEGNKIKIKGLAVYFEPASYMNGVQKIEIIDGDKKILWETDMSENKISVGTIGTPGYTDSVELPRETYADYNFPYLTIMV